MDLNSDSPQIEVEVTTPDTADTAAAEVVDTGTPEVQETPEPKFFSQEELDKIVQERLAKQERKLRREQSQAPERQQAPAATPPDPAQFTSLDEYTEALAEFKAEQKLSQREAATRQKQVETEFEDRAEQAREKYSDYQEVVHNPDLKITPEMAATIMHSEVGPDVAYYLGNNPKEAERISRLSPLLQAREIGKIEANVTLNPPAAKKTSSAPEPLNAINSSRSTLPARNTSDPRSIATMDSDTWIKKRNEELSKQK